MGKREDKIEMIVNQAVNILREEEASSLSMRKVAENCGIRLSNVQYYFPDKEALVKATIESYFKACEKEILGVLPTDGMIIFDLEDLIQKLLNDYLVVGTESDQCAMFREIWAMAVRNKSIAETLTEYYQKYTAWLVNVIAEYAENPKLVISILTPYFEGYSVMGNGLPNSKTEIVNALAKMVATMDKSK